MGSVALTLTFLFAVAAAVPTAVRQGDEGGSLMNVADLINATPEFSILSTLLDGVGAGNTFSGIGSFTFFAPTNAAFGNTAEDLGFTGDKNDAEAVTNFLVTGFTGFRERMSLSASQPQTSFLLFHVSLQRFSSEQVLQATSIPTILTLASIERSSDNPLALQDMAPGVTDPKLIEDKLDIPASNGVVHGIDRMLLREPLTRETFLEDFAAAGGTQAAVNTQDDAEPCDEDYE